MLRQVMLEGTFHADPHPGNVLVLHGGPLFLPTAAGTGGTSLFHVFGYAGLFLSLVLILRVIIAITREGI
jgi:predicted unusual protein kinase regulating ubiquinone biosynthesis (AarF/ABC1/UbiB family)